MTRRVTAEVSNNRIGLLNEKPLHAALKEWLACPGDRFEQPVDGYIIDIVRGEELIEIQTGGFTSLRHKLAHLVRRHPVRLVYPVAEQKWLLKSPRDGNGSMQRRKSPLRQGYEALFAELVRIPRMPAAPNFTLEVLLTQLEEVRHFDPLRRRRRGGWVTEECRLLKVVGRRSFRQPADLLELLPEDLPDSFTTADLAAALRRPRRLAQQMAYCLRELDLLELVGRQGRSLLYVRRDP